MRRVSYVLIAAAMLALTAQFHRVSAAPVGPPNDHVLKIGVVNTARIVHQMQEAKKLEQEFKAQQGRLRDEQLAKEQQVRDAQAHRNNNIRPNTAQWDDETRKIDDMRAALEAWKVRSNVEFERSYKLSLKGIYDHIAAATAQVAEQEHLDLVIADQTPELGPDLDQVTVQQMSQLLQMRAILFYDKKADITEEVLTLVDKNFAQQNPAVGLK